jgi:hypothetical protein
MNFLQVISASFRLYSKHLGWHLLASLELAVAMLVGLGLFCGALLASMLLATAAGSEGSWIKQPLTAGFILITLGVGLIAASFVVFAAFGSFIHTCAQIGAGVREITILGFIEYMLEHGHTYWIISIVQIGIGAGIAFILLALGWLLKGMSGALFAIFAIAAIVAFFAAQFPFWLAFCAQAVERKGAIKSLELALKTSMRSPISSFAGMIFVELAFAIPLPMLIFYPIYFYFVFAPLAADFALVYYEASRGLLK